MTDPDGIELSLHIQAAPELVFSYFTDAERYVQWMGSTAQLDPTPGGIYRVRMRDGVEASGEFVAVEPPRRVVFTWGWTGDDAVPPGSSTVEVTLAEENGGTRVVLRHDGLPDASQRLHHRQGWEQYLDRLTIRASGGDPGRDPNAG